MNYFIFEYKLTILETEVDIINSKGYYCLKTHKKVIIITKKSSSKNILTYGSSKSWTCISSCPAASA